jgi:hypothetical protein
MTVLYTEYLANIDKHMAQIHVHVFTSQLIY